MVLLKKNKYSKITVLGSPCKPPSRVQRVRSAIRDDGAAAAGTGMCRLRRSVRPVGRDEGTREAGGLPGRRLLVLFAKESGLSKVTRPSPKGGRNPFEGKALASCMAKPCQSGEREGVSPPADHKKTAALGLRFFYWLNLLAPDANKAHRP